MHGIFQLAADLSASQVWLFHPVSWFVLLLCYCPPLHSIILD